MYDPIPYVDGALSLGLGCHAAVFGSDGIFFHLVGSLAV
jgi:hypothetical protein